MPEPCIDKTLVRRRFARSAGSYREHAVVQHRMAVQLVDAIGRELAGDCFDRVLEAGCGTGTLTEMLLEQFPVKHLIANDIAGSFRGDILVLAGQHADTRIDFLDGDIETVALPRAVDLVAANAVFQWLTDLDAFFQRMGGCMKRGAAIAFSTFGTGNLQEVAAITGVGLGYRSHDEQRALLEKRFDIVSSWEERAVLRLKTPLDVLRHMKATGTNALDTRYWKKGDLKAFSAEYGRRFGDGDTVALTYAPLFFLARKR